VPAARAQARGELPLLCRSPCPIYSSSARGTGSGTRLGATVVPQPLPEVLKQCPRHPTIVPRPLPDVLKVVPGHPASSHYCAAPLARRAQRSAQARGKLPLPCRTTCPTCSSSARARGKFPLLCRTPCPTCSRSAPGTLHTVFFRPRHRIFARFFAGIFISIAATSSPKFRIFGHS